MGIIGLKTGTDSIYYGVSEIMGPGDIAIIIPNEIERILDGYNIRPLRPKSQNKSLVSQLLTTHCNTK